MTEDRVRDLERPGRDLTNEEWQQLHEAHGALDRLAAEGATQSSGGDLPPEDSSTTDGVTPPAGNNHGTSTGTGEGDGSTSTASPGGPSSKGGGTHTTNGVTAPPVGYGNPIPENTTHPEHIDLANRRAGNLEKIAGKRRLNPHEQEIYDNARRVRDRNAPGQPGDRSSPLPEGTRNNGRADDLALTGDEDPLVPVTPDGEQAEMDAEAADNPPATASPDAIGTMIDGPATLTNPDAPVGQATTRAIDSLAPPQTQSAPSSSCGVTLTAGNADSPPANGRPPPPNTSQEGSQGPDDSSSKPDSATQKDNNEHSPPHEPRKTDGKYYSTVFEMHLDPKVYGTSDDIHFHRANKALHEALLADPDFAARMAQLIPGVTERVSSKGGRENPKGYTWHHEDTPGLMRLVPTSQHTANTPFWKALHPDPQGRGGYALWAIPAGAKPRK